MGLCPNPSACDGAFGLCGDSDSHNLGTPIVGFRIRRRRYYPKPLALDSV